MAYPLTLMELPVHVPEHIPDQTAQFLFFYTEYNSSRI